MKIYSVTEFRAEINQLLGQVTVVIQGEVSDFNISQNRFVWFSLVDEDTVVKCFMMAFHLHLSIVDGMEIRVVGEPTMFKKGQFVFRPRTVELVGEGNMKQAYDLLKKKLDKEGLFNEERKRPLPRFPHKIGLITSRDAAAYTDVLRVLNNRWSGMKIQHLHVNVQGVHAVQSIVDALDHFNAEKDLDCIILTRGGGSLEDLHAFNSEEVVRAIFASRIPIVSGVGHERDITLSDLVADLRASTPSNAAEIVVPDRSDVLSEIQFMIERMENGIRRELGEKNDQVQDAVRLLDEQARRQVTLVNNLRQRLELLFESFVSDIKISQQKLESYLLLLHSYNPELILQRGYSMTMDTKGNIVSSVKQLKVGEQMITRFADGMVESTVNSD